MAVLVDSSVWIDYFKSGANSTHLDYLIDENLVVVNDLILAELVPFLTVKRQMKVIKLLGKLEKLPLSIDWEGIIQLQVDCLSIGMNGVGIPDLLVAQNAKQQQCKVYTLDKHFRFLQQVYNLELF